MSEQTFALIVDNLSPKRHSRSHLFKNGLYAIRETLNPLELTLGKDTNYKELYDYVYDNMKDDDLFHKLNPTNGGFGGLYEARGGDFTLTFWTYMTSLMVDVNPLSVEAWDTFAKALNGYIYDVDIYVSRMLGNRREKDTLPVARLFSQLDALDPWVLHEVYARLISCEGYMAYTVSNVHRSESFENLLNRMYHISVMPYESWVKIARALNVYSDLLREKGIDPPTNVVDSKKAILMCESSTTLFDYMKRNIHHLIQEFQESEELDYLDMLFNGVLVKFMSAANMDLAKVFDVKLDPTKIDLPKDELAMQVLLLTKANSKNEMVSYYDDYYNAHSIYSGKPDWELEESRAFRYSLQEKLLPSCMAGYIEAIKVNDLKINI